MLVTRCFWITTYKTATTWTTGFVPSYSEIMICLICSVSVWFCSNIIFETSRKPHQTSIVTISIHSEVDCKLRNRFTVSFAHWYGSDDPTVQEKSSSLRLAPFQYSRPTLRSPLGHSSTLVLSLILLATDRKTCTAIVSRLMRRVDLMNLNYSIYFQWVTTIATNALSSKTFQISITTRPVLSEAHRQFWKRFTVSFVHWYESDDPEKFRYVQTWMLCVTQW